jgi:hypothetical protein
MMTPSGFGLSAPFAFGFGNALILGWLAAAALPVIIHLWNKRKYREVSWAAMEYLLAAMRKNSRRIQLEQWLLLAVRTLVVVLVVLAMAEPFLERAGLGFVTGTRTLKVLVVDGSYSMAYKPGDKTRFDQAKQYARQIVEDSPQGDGFALVLMAAPPVVVVGQPALEKNDFCEEIDNLKMPDGSGDLSATLAKVQEVVQTATNRNLGRTEIYFLTDLGRTSWGVDQVGSDFRERVESLAKTASLTVLDLGQPSAENLAVTRLSLAEHYATIEREATLTATVQNFGSQAKFRQMVELFVDSRRVDDTLIDCKPGESAPVTFRHRFDSPGDHAVEVRVNPDLLELDNHRWLALPVKPYVRVLCIDGKPAGEGLSGATDYVMLALNPSTGDSTVRSTVRAEVASEGALLDQDLAAYDAVFLCNVGQFTSSEARVLANYVQAGGGLIFFLGDRVDADRYNRELGGESGTRVLPALVGDIMSEAQYRFDPLDYRHPLVAAFKGREQAGLLTTPVYKYFKLKPVEKSRAKVALAFADGDLAVVEEPLGRGRVIMVATEGSLSSIDPLTKSPWTTMPAWPSFVPIVQELLSLAVGSQISAFNVHVGDALGAAVRGPAARESLVMHAPGGREESLRLTNDDEGSRWSYADTFISGLYRVESASAGKPEDQKTDMFYAVNVDPRESNLARIDPTELPEQFSTTVELNSGETTTASVARRSALHRLLLYGVLMLLFVEVFLAWRAGHARA